jgi:hypothetical protein
MPWSNSCAVEDEIEINWVVTGPCRTSVRTPFLQIRTTFGPASSDFGSLSMTANRTAEVPGQATRNVPRQALAIRAEALAPAFEMARRPAGSQRGILAGAARGWHYSSS